ncbi:MAG: hypothetical protein M0C28_49020 [Candidatus Moduliflexus flocculans]|nr:hypothetical protein [Candidatus Moduliflexus flocculans]
MTFHDSCNIARSGDLVEEPRAVLQPRLRRFPGDASQPPGELLLHRRRRPAVHGRIPAPAAGSRRRSRPTSSGPPGPSSSARCATTASTA